MAEALIEDYEYEEEIEEEEEEGIQELRPQEGGQEKALSNTADIVIYGGAAGSGKSYIMLMRPLLYVDDPNFNAVFFRRTGPQLTGAGGLWDEAKAMYAPWNPRIVESLRLIEFPSGAKLRFQHMEHEKDRLNSQGLQFSHVYFDEGTHFTESQVTYLMSRLRSKAKVKSSMFISCNPDPDSFLATYIDWWLDDEGFPDKSKAGVIKHYVLDPAGVPILADSEEELRESHPELLRTFNNKTGKWRKIKPKTMSFVPGDIFDNPALIKANPGYLAELNALPEIEKKRLLHGNWYARPEGSGHYKRAWLQHHDTVPPGIMVRAWDKASTEPSEKNKKPDYTACIGMVKDRWDNFYLVGNFHSENKDRFDKINSEVRGKFRERSGRRDTLIRKQAEHDGPDCTIVMPVDPGGAGKTEYIEACKKLKGFRVKPDPMPTQMGKLTRYLPFSSAAENQMVYIVTSTFNKETLHAFHTENEAFDGERSSDNRKDDWPDTVASAYNYLCTARNVSTVSRNQVINKTIAAPVIENKLKTRNE